MIKINICKGFLAITDEDGQIYPGWVGDDPPSFPDLPEVEAVYQRCVSRNYHPERIIDTLLYIFHRQRIIRSGFLADMSLVIGLVGAAGGGKSCGGAGIAIFDYLLAGVPVISNMDIEVTVQYKQARKVFRTQQLEKASVMDLKHLQNMYKNCCLLVDECNIEFSEARRAMSNKNLLFNYVIQERRKRSMNVIFTSQHEMWVDDRLRYGTSFFIKASDAAYNSGLPKPGSLGRKSNWKVYDFSGLINGDILDDRDPRFIVYKGEFHNRPFWHSYDTYQIQGLEDESEDKNDIIIRDGVELSINKEKYSYGIELSNKIIGMGIERLPTDDLWKMLDVEGNRREQTRIGMQLSGVGIPTETIGNKKYYIFGDSLFSDNGHT